jgi:hypothetical protein
MIQPSAQLLHLGEHDRKKTASLVISLTQLRKTSPTSLNDA